MASTEKCDVAIIGGGRMGCGIAFIFANAGHKVIVCDPSEQTRAGLSEKVSEICALLSIDKDAIAPISSTDDIGAAVKTAGFVVEAGPENLEIKQSIFAQIDDAAPADAILATNTSAIPIAQIAQTSKHQGRIVGAHFWNPPHLIELVEVIVGANSYPAAADKAVQILSSVGMTAVLVKKDIPGFIGNRLQHALKREAIALVADGVCDARTVDDVVKLGFGARLPIMGPLEQSDLLGLELTQAVHKTLMPAIDVTPIVHPHLTALIDAGKTGANVGEGFRKWTKPEADEAREKLNAHLVEAARARYAANKQV